MIIAHVVIETQPGRAQHVAQRMLSVKGLGELHVASDHNLDGRFWLPDGDTAEGLSEALRAFDGDIVAVHPSFMDAA